MKVTIKGTASTDDEFNITLSDETLDNDAWVTVSFGTGIDLDVPLDQLMSAVIAFESKRSRRLVEENHQ